jgi:hypothetical protein
MKKVDSAKFTLPKKLVDISSKDRRPLIPRGLKLCEEAGECAAEILKYSGYKGRKGKTEKQVLNHLRLEAVDCLIMAMDILVATKTADKQINEIMNGQLDKWQGQIKSKKVKLR